MPKPPLAEFVDDRSLDGSIGLLRRISPAWVDFEDPDGAGKPRIRGPAFQRHTIKVAQQYGYSDRCMSLGLEEGVLQAGGLDKMLANWSGYGLARVTAADLRETSFGLQRAPEPDLGEPWHVVAFALGSSNAAKKAQGVLAARAELLIPPTRP